MPRLRLKIGFAEALERNDELGLHGWLLFRVWKMAARQDLCWQPSV